MTKQLVTVVNKVNNQAIRRIKNERGDLVYVVPSYTMPDNVVMNNVFYPAEEIAKSYQSLENTPAPLSHPVDVNGNFVSANSPDGILYYQCGVFNKNVQRVQDPRYGHRLYVEKHIHVETAMNSERGRRLIEAIDKGEPIHSSTGILLNFDETPGVNANGKKYERAARDLEYDHDAILLDEEGAATPADGTGMLINSHLIKQVSRNGQQMAVHSARLDTDQPEPESKLLANIKTMLDGFFNRLAGSGEAPTTNKEGDDMAIKDMLKKRLGDKFEENMSDEDMLDTYAKSMKGNAAEQPEAKGEQKPAQGEQVANADLEKLIADTVAKALAANQAATEAAERAKLAEQLKANSLELEQADIDGMTVNALRKMVDKTKPAGTAFNFAGGAPIANHQPRFSADTLPE